MARQGPTTADWSELEGTASTLSPHYADEAKPNAFGAGALRQLAGFYGLILLLHFLGWGLLLHASGTVGTRAGLGLAAYMFGLRHAFDADHIAAVDDTVRYLLRRGSNPLGVGFFFSLGHSSIVMVVALTLVIVGAAAKAALPQLHGFGALLGAGISGVFLWMIGILNVLVLLDILRHWRSANDHEHSHADLDRLLSRRGLVYRLFGGRLSNAISHSWQMFPVGMLFGLGFDTASEVGLLGMTASTSAGDLPISAALSLPVLFAAGMSLMDTTDGVVMVKAYDWALIKPSRKLFYNLVTTVLSITVALAIGTIELLQLMIGIFHFRGVIFDRAATLEFGEMGYFIVGLFLLSWAVSAVIWKVSWVEPDH